MTFETTRRLIAVLGLIAWLPFVFSLYPLPHQRAVDAENEIRQAQKDLGPLAKHVNPKPIEDQVNDIQAAGWTMWTVSLLAVIAGIVASMLAFRNIGSWRGLMLTLSIFFLAFFVLDFLIAPYGTVGEILSWKLRMIEKFKENGLLGSYVFFTLKEFVLPIIHLLLLSLVLYCWSNNRTKINGVGVT